MPEAAVCNLPCERQLRVADARILFSCNTNYLYIDTNNKVSDKIYSMFSGGPCLSSD